MDEKVKESEAQDEVKTEQEDTPETEVAKEDDSAIDATDTESNTDAVEAVSETEPEVKEEEAAEEKQEEAIVNEEVVSEEKSETVDKTPEVKAEEAPAEAQSEPETKEEKPQEEEKVVAEEEQPKEEPATETPFKADIPSFQSGDTIIVHYKIREGGKERIQLFQGVVLQRKGTAPNQTFTVRKISSGIGVERIFPLASPLIDKIEVKKGGKVRRARIYYLRERTGKSARIKERRG